MGCEWWQVLCNLKQEAKHVVNNSITSALKDFGEVLKSSAKSFFDSLSNFWTTISFPDITDPNGGYHYLRSMVDQITPYIAIIAMIFGGFKIVKTLKIYPAGDIIIGILRLMFTTSGALFIVPQLGHFSDDFTAYIIQNSPHNVQIDLFGNSALGNIGDIFVDIILNAVLTLVSLSLLIVMIVRPGIILLIAATMPWGAAISISGNKETFNKQLSWLIAWIIYKPIAALVLSFSILQINSKDNLINSLSGICMLVLCLILMPVLFKLVVPAASNTADYWFGHHLSNASAGMTRATIHTASNLTNKATDSKTDRISKL